MLQGLAAQMNGNVYILADTEYYKDLYGRKKTSPEKAKFKKEISRKGNYFQEVTYDLRTNQFMIKEVRDVDGQAHGLWLRRNKDGSLDSLDYDFKLQEFYRDTNLCKVGFDGLDSLDESDGYTNAILRGIEGDPVMGVYKKISMNTRYPVAAKDQKITGTVYLQYIVETNASIQEYSIIKGAHPLLDKEALRVVKSLRYEKPAMLKGEAVRQCYSLPIKFNLR
jgi:protein TonB